MAQNYNIGALGRVLTVNSTANTATYTSALVVGNSSVNVVVNSSSVYVNGSPVGGATNTAAQYTWTNTHTFSNVVTHTANVLANSVLVVANSMATSIATSATANGSTQGTAYPITTTSVQFTTVASGTGAILPTCVPGQRIFIANDGANNLLLYPPSGGVIDQSTTNTPVTIVAYGMWEGMALTSVNWTSVSPDSQGANGVVASQGNGAIILSVNSAYIATLAANNTTYLNGQPASYYTNATNITTGTLPYAQIPANVINTTAAFTISGVYTHSANLVMSTTAGISANGGYGTAGQVLTSNGTTVYWSTVSGGGGSVNTAAAYTWTNTHTFSNPVVINGALTVGTSSAIRRAVFANGEINFVPYTSAESIPANTQYYMNLCDSAGNNGSLMTLNIRGLASGGSAGATLAGVSMTTAFLGVSGDVISNYSDMRLKNVSGPVLGALDKVSKINTFYYTPNKMALSIGADNEMKTRIGVSAQQMQEILPEVVFDSPLGQGYITVQYERIVPLLIEAIKELKAEVDRLNKEKQE